MPSKLEASLVLVDELLIGLVVLILLTTLGFLDVFMAIIIGIGMVAIFVVSTHILLKPQFLKPKVGAETMIGKRCRSITPIKPTGEVQVNGEYWSAISTEPINENIEVEIIGFNGLKLRVRKVTNTDLT